MIVQKIIQDYNYNRTKEHLNLMFIYMLYDLNKNNMGVLYGRFIGFYYCGLQQDTDRV